MTWIERLFSMSLKLYPRQFRIRFTSEMEEVFTLGLMDAKKEGSLVGYVLREILRFPADLLGMHLLSLQTSDERQLALSGVGNGSSSGETEPGTSWRSSFMAGLPHLLLALFIIGSELLFTFQGGIQKVSSYLLWIGLIISIGGVLFYCIRKGWKIWSATWLVYIFGIVITLLSVLANALPHTIIGNADLINSVGVLVLPILMAYLLYKIACKGRVWGLLAAIPLSVIPWILFLEFVPVVYKTLAWGWILFLAFVASVMIVRTNSLSRAVLLAMAVPILGGLPFVYLGVYMGGSLPFTAPGANMTDVAKQFLQFLPISLAAILGPLLAVKLRMIGNRYANEGGNIFYRLALGGILFGLFFSLIQWLITSSGIRIDPTAGKGLLVVSMILFLVGFSLLFETAYRNKSSVNSFSEVVGLAVVFIPLLFLPALIFLAINAVSGNYGNNWSVILVDMVLISSAFLVVKN